MQEQYFPSPSHSKCTCTEKLTRSASSLPRLKVINLVVLLSLVLAQLPATRVNGTPCPSLNALFQIYSDTTSIFTNFPQSSSNFVLEPSPTTSTPPYHSVLRNVAMIFEGGAFMPSIVLDASAADRWLVDNLTVVFRGVMAALEVHGWPLLTLNGGDLSTLQNVLVEISDCGLPDAQYAKLVAISQRSISNFSLVIRNCVLPRQLNLRMVEVSATIGNFEHSRIEFSNLVPNTSSVVSQFVERKFYYYDLLIVQSRMGNVSHMTVRLIDISLGGGKWRPRESVWADATG